MAALILGAAFLGAGAGAGAIPGSTLLPAGFGGVAGEITGLFVAKIAGSTFAMGWVGIVIPALLRRAGRAADLRLRRAAARKPGASKGMRALRSVGHGVSLLGAFRCRVGRLGGGHDDEDDEVIENFEDSEDEAL